MRRVLNKFRLLLCTFSGEDDYIIRRCSSNIKISFALVGLFVILVFIGCLVSATAFMANLIGYFNLVSILIGVLFAMIVSIIYLLLLYTISPTILPIASKKRIKGKVVKLDAKKTTNNTFSFSMSFRIGLILVFAMIISQPINILLLQHTIKNELNHFKSEYKVKMIVQTDSLFMNKELENLKVFFDEVNTKARFDELAYIRSKSQLIENKIKSDSTFINQANFLLKQSENLKRSKNKNKSDINYEQLDALIASEITNDSLFLLSLAMISFHESNFQPVFNILKESMQSIITQKRDNYVLLTKLIDSSDFYITKIKIVLQTNPLSWLITIIVCLVFLIPIKVKYIVRKRSTFYKKKEEIEKQLIIEEYNQFKTSYLKVLKNKYEILNSNTLSNLTASLNKLQVISEASHNRIMSELKKEMADIPKERFEYWADMPYRTSRRVKSCFISEAELLRKIYDL